MASHVVHLAALSAQDREGAPALSRLVDGDRVELRIWRRDGDVQTVALPPAMAAAIDAVLTRLLQGERLAVLIEDQELSPNEAAEILGMSRPLVVHRMAVGDLPFRYVGNHRRTKLKDVLALQSRLERQQAALDELAEDTEALTRDHGL